ncbi:hypothetical protein BJX61DRAFT_499447 [Aspergillus egyptiacus]|nr:hypothetical protein BJX61DRAFT_499447 [Aspergillus egyptiacus]
MPSNIHLAVSFCLVWVAKIFHLFRVPYYSLPGMNMKTTRLPSRRLPEGTYLLG